MIYTGVNVLFDLFDLFCVSLYRYQSETAQMECFDVLASHSKSPLSSSGRMDAPSHVGDAAHGHTLTVVQCLPGPSPLLECPVFTAAHTACLLSAACTHVFVCVLSASATASCS